MEVMFLDTPYKKEFKLNKKTLDYLKKYKKVGVYSSVQFISKLNNVLKQLKENKVEYCTSKPKRANKEFQILGCDVFHGSLNLKKDVDCFLYIGDGEFHPLALVLLQKDSKKFKEVLTYNPIGNKFEVLTQKNVIRILKKYKGSLLKFLNSNNIGVLVTVKPGQQQFKQSLKLEKMYDKKFYYFVDNDMNFNNLENFNFIDCWVNTTCPRIGFDDAVNFRSMVNLNDALNAKEILSKESILNKK
ncbi:2-(3-amino-3-carboxypropyl)histidine synthase subunit [archaeon]|nr:2-(3-amino-3-carboxypropyl)histidine synthase subunit [archaeon]